MKLWLISQSVNQERYDVYDSAVVAAEDEDEARHIHPSGQVTDNEVAIEMWCKPEQVKVTYLGEAAKRIKSCVICASFNAG